MALKYVTKDGWHFQYLLDNAKQFYRALVTYQGATASATAIVEETVGDPMVGTVKTIFPGGDITSDDALY